MKDFSEMNLSLVEVSGFNISALYCLDDSPLQNQTNFKGCYGICANPDVAGIGNRISLYIQTILTLWLACLTPEPDDTLGAMLAAIAASFTIFVATLASYARNDITLHHTIITINLSNLPTVAFFAGILRLRLQPGVIPLGPKLFATPILALQFLACTVSVFLGVGLNAVTSGGAINSANSGRGGNGGWEVSQPQCNPDTQVIVFGRSLQFWKTESADNLSNMTSAERIVVLVAYGIIIFLPFISSIICLYLPETGTLRTFAHAFHQEQRTPFIALFSFFLLANIWTGILIYATETQISKNKVLPGEAVWGSGQILAMILIVIPLLGCIRLLVLEVGNRNHKARKWIKRTKAHRILGVKFTTGHQTPSAPGTPATPALPSRPPTPRRKLTNDSTTKSDLESGMKSPSIKSPKEEKDLGSMPTLPHRQTSEVSGSRRLSKRSSRWEPKSPEDIRVVSPGEDSGPEDEPGSARPKLVSESTQNTLVDGWKDIYNNRKSRGSIAGHNTHSVTGNVRTIVQPDGEIRRVLSRRNSVVSPSSERPDDRKSETSGRRLSKSRPGSVSASRRSKSEDGYWSATSASRPDPVVSPRRDERNDNDTATVRQRDDYFGERARVIADEQSRNDNDDPLAKYYWDPQRGWLERQ